MRLASTNVYENACKSDVSFKLYNIENKETHFYYEKEGEIYG